MSLVTPQVREGVAVAPPKNLSPSATTMWEQCPQKFAYSKIYKLPDPPGKDAEMGTFVHDVLEALFKMDAPLRTQAEARSICRDVWTTKGWVERVAPFNMTAEELSAFRWQAWWCVEALWKIEDPATVAPLGVEHWVRGYIGGVRVLGAMDRFEEHDGGVTIVDYKTGKKPKVQYEGEKKTQLAIYKILVEQMIRKPVTNTVLYYLKDGLPWSYAPTPDEIAGVEALIKRVWSEVLAACATGTFDQRVGPLCDWCSFKGVCPAFS